MQPVLKQRKTKIVSGWLTRDSDGVVTLWDDYVERGSLNYRVMGHLNEAWWSCGWEDSQLRQFEDYEFMALYTGIPRKGRAIYVQIEIVVD